MRQAMRPRVRQSESGILVLATRGIDPCVEMATLEALLSDRALENIIGRSRFSNVLAERDGGEVMVVTLTDELQSSLAAASPDQLAELSHPWSQSDEFRGQGDPESLTNFLLELADLARKANDRGQRLYCWACV